MYIHIIHPILICVYIYIHIYYQYMYMCVYIYIYIYILSDGLGPGAHLYNSLLPHRKNSQKTTDLIMQDFIAIEMLTKNRGSRPSAMRAARAARSSPRTDPPARRPSELHK